MNTKQLNRIFVRTMYVIVIAVLVFSVTGSALAEEPAPPRIYAGLTDESIRYELTTPNALVTFSLYSSQGGELLSEITKEADETGFVWISIWEHRQELTPGTFIVVRDATYTNELMVEEVSIDLVKADENILSGKAPAGSFVWVVANNEPDRCGISVEAAANNTWQFDFDDLGCDISADMVFYAQVMDDEGDTSEANPDFIDGWHDGAEGVGHPNSCNVNGFATDTDDRDRDLEIRVLSDGSEIASTLANGFWDGFIGECGKDGTCGFYVNLWGLEGFSLYQQHEITIQAYDVETEQWKNLGGTPRLLTCANYDLYIFDTKTGKAEGLTINLPNTGEYNPSWSNNGKQIVHDVADANFHALYITDVKTKVSSPLLGGEGGNDASWSPNGKWIVFDRRWFDNDTNLYLLTPKGGTPTLVVSNATNGDWSPDSQRLVFERDGGLWTASVNGGDEQQVVEAGYGPAWSPDGLWIAYDLDGDIWKIAVDEFGVRAGDPIQLTSGPVSEGGTTWSQNGEFIVFASDATGDHDIWQIAAEGGVPTQLRGTIGYGDYDPDYSSNGQFIAYEGAMEPSVPHVESDTWLNTYALADWPVGQLINVSIDNPATSKQPDYRTTFTPYGTSNWYLFQPGLDIQPGFVITAKSKFFTKTLAVSNLAATDIDAESGMISGVATPNNSFYMVADGDHFRLPSGQGVSVDENGNWTADFSGADAPRPWTWYAGGEMFEWDVDGDMTHAFWHLHQEVIEVWLPYNEIRAFDWPLNTELIFSVFDPASNTTYEFTAWTEPTVWMNGTWAVVNTGNLQLQPGMVVTVTDGATTKDMVIQDIKINYADPQNEIVYGYAPLNASLELGSWEDSPVFRFFNAGDDGKWVINYQEPSLNGTTVDLDPGDDIRLFMRDEEKDSTVYEYYVTNPITFVSYLPSAIEGYGWPMGNLITININDGEYVAEAYSEQRPDSPEGETRVLFDLGRDNFSIEAGDHIVMTDGYVTKDTVVTNLAVTDIDPNTGIVLGTYDPTHSLWVWLYGLDGQVPAMNPEDGTWAATFDPLPFGATGGATQWETDGDGTSLDFQVPVTFFVTSVQDVVANDGVCTLREAVIAANTNAPSGDMEGECPAGLDSQTDTILLATDQTYSLTIDNGCGDDQTCGDLDIWDNSAPFDLIIKVDGDGKATISQNALVDDRVLENYGATMQMVNLIITNGGNVGGGGGLLNNGNLEIIEGEIRRNSAGWDGGGIWNGTSATLVLDSCSIASNYSDVFGGGIMNKGMLTVNKSEVRANSTPVKGGGIANEGTLIVNSSVLSGNSADGQGGALYNYGTVTIQNNTLVGGPNAEDANRAEGGGGLFSLGILTVNDSIVTGNQANYGGGLFNWIGGMLTINNSKVSNNWANEGGGLHNKEGGTAIIQNGSVFSGNYAEWGGGGIDNWGMLTITGSTLRENMSLGVGDAIASGVFSESSASVTGSCIVGNGDVAVFTNLTTLLNFTGNWWGDTSGPSGAGSGSGDSVSDYIDFSDWLSEPPSICPAP